MTDLSSSSPVPVRRGWRLLAIAGCAMVALTLLAVLLAFDKKHFGWLVGSAFLPLVACGVLLGALLLAIATWNLPVRRNWRGFVLFAWALIALTSPLFGYLFLLPFGVLALSLPIVVWILRDLFRTA